MLWNFIGAQLSAETSNRRNPGDNWSRIVRNDHAPEQIKRIAQTLEEIQNGNRIDQDSPYPSSG
jgi:hypothetical protein